jgi:hypothetical protein
VTGDEYGIDYALALACCCVHEILCTIDIMTKALSSLHQPTLSLAGLFATAIDWCYRLFAAASSASRGKNETIHDEYHQGDTDPSRKINDQPVPSEKNIKALSIPTFAWEVAPIAKDEKSSVGTPSPPERLITTRHISGDQEADKTLEFFATMTFANGGLRAPSCPCCQ